MSIWEQITHEITIWGWARGTIGTDALQYLIYNKGQHVKHRCGENINHHPLLCLFYYWHCTAYCFLKVKEPTIVKRRAHLKCFNTIKFTQTPLQRQIQFPYKWLKKIFCWIKCFHLKVFFEKYCVQSISSLHNCFYFFSDACTMLLFQMRIYPTYMIQSHNNIYFFIIPFCVAVLISKSCLQSFFYCQFACVNSV